MTSPLPGEKPMTLRDAVGGMIHAATQVDAEPYELAGQVLDVVAREARTHCTPGADAYRAGGDTLVYAVADWISRDVHGPSPLPTDEDARETLRRIYDEHIYVVTGGFNAGCRCGWRGKTINSAIDFREHFLDEMAAGFRRSVVSTPSEPVAYAIYGRATGNLKYVEVLDPHEVKEQSEFYDVVPLYRSAVSAPPTITDEAVQAFVTAINEAGFVLDRSAVRKGLAAVAALGGEA